MVFLSMQIGEVVDGPDDGMKRPVLDGSEYDYGQDLMSLSACTLMYISCEYC